jgi:hopanoid biosynthesis associated protein HpnK
MKQLIITSDDFGLSSGVNRAVEKAWQEGILTCASIMPGAAAFKDAVATALVQGNSVLLQGDIHGLVDWKRRFTDNPVAAGMSYFFNKKLHQPLKKEIEAQIRKVIDAGIELTHIDGHLNIHQHPTVFAILTELMPKYGITSFRLSRERLKHNLQFDKERVFGKRVENFIFSRLSENCLPALDRLGITYAAEVKGVLNSGRMTSEYILNILDGLHDGLTEIYFHPGILPDAEISRRMPDYRHEDELKALTDSKIRDKIASLGIELVNYRKNRKSNA